MTGPRRSKTARTFREDDRAVAAVLGFVLVLAVLVSYLAYVANADVPRWGAEAERSWDRSVGDALARLDRAAAAGLGTDASTTIAVPGAPTPRAFDVPLVARTQPVAPSGSIAFEPDCGGIDALHEAEGAIVPDIRHGARGCLVFREQGTYAPSYSYRTELGGLLRVERNQAFVVTGPPLDLKNEGARYLVSASFVDLRGASNAATVGGAGTPLDFAAGPSHVEQGQATNAASANWTFQTAYPAAWKAWFDGQLAGASFDPALNYVCAGGPSAACPDLAANEVRVILKGPQAASAIPDLALSISHGRYDVTIR